MFICVLRVHKRAIPYPAYLICLVQSYSASCLHLYCKSYLFCGLLHDINLGMSDLWVIPKLPSNPKLSCWWNFPSGMSTVVTILESTFPGRLWNIEYLVFNAAWQEDAYYRPLPIFMCNAMTFFKCCCYWRTLSFLIRTHQDLSAWFSHFPFIKIISLHW